jgi:hypothetical protein
MIRIFFACLSRQERQSLAASLQRLVEAHGLRTLPAD